jgi:outer membrane protein OmpA-like peptidoglycan-associated protein
MTARVVRGVVLLGLVLAVACARTPAPAPPLRDDLFVVIPDAEGKAGAVVIRQAGGETVLDRPYAAARAAAGGGLERATVTEREVQQIFGPTLAAQPPALVHFRLYFVVGKDELTPESQQALVAVLEEIKRRPDPEVIVVGHTDLVGAVAFNDRLSLQRADRVRQELIGIGIPAEKITVAGRGKREPLVPTDDEVPEPRNRRVEITVR